MNKYTNVFSVPHAFGICFFGILIFLLSGCSQNTIKPDKAADKNDHDTQDAGYICGEVDALELLDKTSYADEARNRIKKEFGPRDSHLVSLIRKNKSLEDEYNKNNNNYSETEKEMMRNRILQNHLEIVELQNEFKDDLKKRRQEELENVQKILLNDIVASAKNNRLDGIVNTENELIYSRIDKHMKCSKTVPYTQTVIDEINSGQHK